MTKFNKIHKPHMTTTCFSFTALTMALEVKHPSAAADLSNGVNLHNGVVMPHGRNLELVRD